MAPNVLRLLVGVALAAVAPVAIAAPLATTSGHTDSRNLLEAVPGAARAKPLQVARTPTIDPAALTAATDYAAAQASGSLLVWHAGALAAAWYAPGRDATAAIESKSLSRALTAIAVGRALALDKLRSLDQPAADLITEWRGTPKAAILVRHLLDMRSGLRTGGAARSDDGPVALQPDRDRSLVADLPLSDPTGTRYEDNDANAELASLLIERATGRRYAEFLSTEVLRPIGASGGYIRLDRQGRTARGGCCVALPAESWARLGILLLDDGRWAGAPLLPAGYVAAMRTPTRENPWHGLGVYVAGPYVERRGFANPVRPQRKVLHANPYAAADLFLFDGDANQAVWIAPSQRLVIVRTGDWGKRGGPDEWDNSRLPNLLIAGIRRAPGDAPPTPQHKDED